MHYYQFNIGDYMSHTKGLTIFEDLAYRRMLDEYYLHESPLPLSVSEIARQIGLPERHEEITYVLSKFFVETDKGYVNSRAQKEIKKYKANQKKKSEAGKLSGKVRRNKALGVEQTLNTCSTNDELNINHKPITNNQETIIKPAKQSKKITLGKYLEQCKAGKVKAIPDNHPLFDYMDKQSLPEEFVLICWRKFVNYYRDGMGARKLYIDWPSTFMNNVKNNYYKLWYLDEQNRFALTTAGKQAKTEFADHE